MPPRDEALAVGVLAAATLVAARPWAWRSDLAFAQGDTAFTLVSLLHLQDAPAAWSAGRLGWGLPWGITHADWVAAEALIGLPLRQAGADALRMHSLLVLLGLFATAWAGHRVAVALLGPGPHTWIAGVAAGLGPIQLAHAPHVNLVWHAPVLLGPLALGAGLDRDRPAWAALGGAVVAGAFHFGVYMGVQALAVAAVVALAARRGSPSTWLAAFAGFAALGITVAPVLAVYAEAAAAHGTWADPIEVRAESWDLAATLRPLGSLPAQGGKVWTDPVHPGYLVALLAIGALVGRASVPARWPWTAVIGAIVAAGLLALGPELTWDGRGLGIPGPYALIDDLPGVSGLRAPVRWWWIVAAGLGLLAAAGLKAGLDRIGERWRGVVGLLAVLVALIEVPAAGVRPRSDVAVPRAYALLDSTAIPGALYDEAAVVEGASCGCRRQDALRAALLHGRPLVGGHYAREGKALEELDAQAARWPANRAWLVENGVVAVLEHPPLAPDPGGSCEQADGHRLCTLPATGPEWAYRGKVGPALAGTAARPARPRPR
jgi:hypothetical protein